MTDASDAERELAAPARDEPPEDISQMRAETLALITEAERMSQKLLDHVDVLRAYLQMHEHESEESPNASE